MRVVRGWLLEHMFEGCSNKSLGLGVNVRWMWGGCGGSSGGLPGCWRLTWEKPGRFWGLWENFVFSQGERTGKGL